ncbi:hypothetical protein C8J56DRAFT_912691 [Mycena floridula]|nr:hypothetical protein C8J56DRAFT_912691 [Mycena floridula]
MVQIHSTAMLSILGMALAMPVPSPDMGALQGLNIRDVPPQNLGVRDSDLALTTRDSNISQAFTTREAGLKARFLSAIIRLAIQPAIDKIPKVKHAGDPAPKPASNSHKHKFGKKKK